MKLGHRSSRAFTLIEMLVVIGIIAMLLAILAPTVTRARAEARAVNCQHNLHSIFSGVAMWRTNNVAGVLPDGYWRPAVARYVNAKGAWQCPDDEIHDPIKDSPVFNYAIKVNDGTGKFLGYYLELHEGPWCDKRNVTANSYELWMEDIIGGGDNDRNDVMVKVTLNPDGSYTLECRRGSAGYGFDLVDLSTGKLVQKDFGRSGPYIVPGLIEGYICSYGLLGRALGTVAYFNSQPDRVNLNYGRADKIYGMEYGKQVADPMKDNWQSDPLLCIPNTTKLTFARHFGEFNAVMGDGHIERFKQRMVDPIYPDNVARLWDPPK